MVHGEVVGLMNGELVMGGILEGDYKDRMADRLQVLHRATINIRKGIINEMLKARYGSFVRHLRSTGEFGINFLSINNIPLIVAEVRHEIIIL